MNIFKYCFAINQMSAFGFYKNDFKNDLHKEEYDSDDEVKEIVNTTSTVVLAKNKLVALKDDTEKRYKPMVTSLDVFDIAYDIKEEMVDFATSNSLPFFDLDFLKTESVKKFLSTYDKRFA